jgi:hypothetical protein
MEMLERYISEIEEDLKIDQFNIKEASLKSPGRKHFWVSRLINHKRNLQSLENKKLDLKKQIMDQIHDQSPVKLSTYTVDKTSDDSGMIREIQVKINEEKLIIEFLEKTEKIFSSLTYDIKNIIEIMKLETL